MNTGQLVLFVLTGTWLAAVLVYWLWSRNQP